MPNYKFEKSNYHMPQHGNFETFTVLSDGEVLFYWSDSSGIVSGKYKKEIEEEHKLVYPIYAKMEAAQKEADKIFDMANDGSNTFTVVFSRDGRTDEFGVNWIEI